VSVYRKRYVFRDDRETKLLGSLSLVSATTVAALIVFAGTASGNTSVTTGDATGGIVIGGGSVSEITLEVSGTGAVVVAGPAVGVQRNFGFATGSMALGGTARCDAVGSGAITFSGTATVGSIFTMDASGAVVCAGTAAPETPTTTASGAIALGGTVGPGEISGGTTETTASGTIAFSGTAFGNEQSTVSGEISFEGTARGVRGTSYETPFHRTCIIKRERKR
jgi:hypothetical protein